MIYRLLIGTSIFATCYTFSYYCVNKKCAVCNSTLMHGAAHKKKPLFLFFLRIIGGDPKKKNIWGDNPYTLLDSTEEEKNWIVRNEPEDEPEDEPKNRTVNFILWLPRKIINMECQLCGSTSLHNAVWERQYYKLQVLISLGGNTLKKNMWGDTPMSLINHIF